MCYLTSQKDLYLPARLSSHRFYSDNLSRELTRHTHPRNHCPVKFDVSLLLHTSMYIVQCLTLQQGAHPTLLTSHHHTQIRSHSNLALKYANNPSILDRLRSLLGLPLSTKFKKQVLRVSALRLYLCCVELIDQDQFIKEFELEDTFISWFRITELHLWMVFARINAEGYDGRFIRNNMMRRFWNDVSIKAKKMGPSARSVRSDQIADLSDQIRHALFAYDEGLHDSDHVLAGALWRTFFQFECQDAEKLENMVHYVRKQMRHLDEQEGDVILKEGLVTFLPLEGHKEDTARSSRILKNIYNRVFDGFTR